jgi:type I restriction enzyme, S subunit
MAPNNWTAVALGQLFKSRREKGRAGVPTLSVTLNDGLVDRTSLDRKTDTNLTSEDHLSVMPGDIAYNMMRMWQGASGLCTYEGIVSPAYVVLKPTEGIDTRFAAYLFKSPHMIHRFWAYSYGLTSDRLRLYFKDFSAIVVDLPTVKEQIRIAEILFTWDQAIQATKRLIENHRTQTRGLAEQLLTGKIRLQHPETVWTPLNLRDLTEIVYGSSPKGIADTNGTFPIIGTGGVIGHTNRTTSNKPGIVIGRKGSIDTPQLIATPFWATDTTFFCVPTDACDLNWLYQRLKSISLAQYNEASGVPSLSRETLYSILIDAPPKEEQVAIAKILTASDMIEANLQATLGTFVAQRVALMEQLFSGKRRVHVTSSAKERASA